MPIKLTHIDRSKEIAMRRLWAEVPTLLLAGATLADIELRAKRIRESRTPGELRERRREPLQHKG